MKCLDCPNEVVRKRPQGPPPQRCPSCRAARRRETDKHAHRRQRHTPEYKAKYRAYTLQKNYGMTVEQYDEMFEKQGGRCAICRSDEPGWSKGWHVDHCHQKGHVRGVLCHKCNLMIGLASDNPDTLRAAANYLSMV